MKKNSVFALAFLFLFSCGDNAGSANENTGDTTSNAERPVPADRTDLPPTPAQEYAAPPSTVTPEEVVKDTPRTSVSVGKDGASIKTKKGTGVSYDKEGVKVNSKDVKIDIKRDSL